MDAFAEGELSVRVVLDRGNAVRGQHRHELALARIGHDAAERVVHVGRHDERRDFRSAERFRERLDTQAGFRIDRNLERAKPEHLHRLQGAEVRRCLDRHRVAGTRERAQTSDSASAQPQVTMTSSGVIASPESRARFAISRRSASAPDGVTSARAPPGCCRVTLRNARASAPVGSSSSAGSAVPSGTSAELATISRTRMIRSPVVIAPGSGSATAGSCFVSAGRACGGRT